MSQTERMQNYNDSYEKYVSRKVSWGELCELEEQKDADERKMNEQFFEQQMEIDSELFNTRFMIRSLASKQLKMLIAMRFNTLIEGSVSSMYHDLHIDAEQAVISLQSSANVADACKDIGKAISCVLDPSFQYLQKACNLEMVRLTAELEKKLISGVLL